MILLCCVLRPSGVIGAHKLGEWLFFLTRWRSGLIVSRGLTPERAARVRVWPGTLCRVLGQDTSLLQYLSLPRCINGYTCEFNVQGNPAMDWHPIQREVEIFLAASYCRNRDKLRPDGSYGLNADITPLCLTVIRSIGREMHSYFGKVVNHFFHVFSLLL